MWVKSQVIISDCCGTFTLNPGIYYGMCHATVTVQSGASIRYQGTITLSPGMYHDTLHGIMLYHVAM